jgi:hypothetical protein
MHLLQRCAYISYVANSVRHMGVGRRGALRFRALLLGGWRVQERERYRLRRGLFILAANDFRALAFLLYTGVMPAPQYHVGVRQGIRRGWDTLRGSAAGRIWKSLPCGAAIVARGVRQPMMASAIGRCAIGRLGAKEKAADFGIIGRHRPPALMVPQIGKHHRLALAVKAWLFVVRHVHSPGPVGRGRLSTC